MSDKKERDTDIKVLKVSLEKGAKERRANTTVRKSVHVCA